MAPQGLIHVPSLESVRDEGIPSSPESPNVTPSSSGDVPLEKNVEAFINLMRYLGDNRQCSFIVRRRDLVKMMEMFRNIGLIKQVGTYWVMSNDTYIQWEQILAGHQAVNCYCSALQSKQAEINETLSELCTSVNKILESRGQPFIENIELDTNDIHELAHVLFWYFRKGVVDLLLKDIAKQSDCTAMSVGSTRISSDYDVTVNAGCASSLLRTFNDRFRALFYLTSDLVFDTNIYGSAMILAEPPAEHQKDLYQDVNCNPHEALTQTYWILRDPKPTNNPTYLIPQYGYALLKVHRGIYRFLGRNESTANALFPILQRVMFVNKSRIIPWSPKDNREMMKWRSQVGGQGPLAMTKEAMADFVEASNAMEMYIQQQFNIMTETQDYATLLNSISAINSRGNEMYYTRAAIIDVVHNQQSCKGRKFALSDDEYLQSAMEQFGDWLDHHFKVKYLERMHSALSKMSNLSGEEKAILDIFEYIVRNQKHTGGRIPNLANLMLVCEVMVAYINEIYNKIAEVKQNEIYARKNSDYGRTTQGPRRQRSFAA